MGHENDGMLLTFVSAHKGHIHRRGHEKESKGKRNFQLQNGSTQTILSLVPPAAVKQEGRLN